MPNTIALAKNYTSLLDEVYRAASVTADLTSDSTMSRAGANANEIIYPQISVTGLGEYDRNSGYTTGAHVQNGQTVTDIGSRPRTQSGPGKCSGNCGAILEIERTAAAHGKIFGRGIRIEVDRSLINLQIRILSAVVYRAGVLAVNDGIAGNRSCASNG